MSFCTAELLYTNFPASRTMVKIRSTRLTKKTGCEIYEERFYLSNQPWEKRLSEDGLNLIRSHWAGVKNRDHYHRDATLSEDNTLGRNPNILATSPFFAVSACFSIPSTPSPSPRRFL